MAYLPIVLTVAVVHLLAVISPGPDFMMITRNSLIYSRKAGMYSAVGLGFGILVHVTYSLIGIGYLISKSILLFSFIKYLGAAYLIYIGYKSITSKRDRTEDNVVVQKREISRWKAIQIGFLTNVLNPKATLFFLSLFTIVIDPKTPLGVKMFMGAEMSAVTVLWFVFVAYIFSHNLIKDRLNKVQHYAEKFIGAILIGLGVKVALSTSR